MGYIKHNAIVVTTFDDNFIWEIVGAAEAIGLDVTQPLFASVNGYWSVLIGPDGSKEGWKDSDMGDVKRKVLRDFLVESQRKRSKFCDWVEVAYGGDFEQDNDGAAIEYDSQRFRVDEEAENGEG